MQIETQRLLIRDIKTEDEVPLVKMAADGSLNDCGFDRDCGSWITKWVAEAKVLHSEIIPIWIIWLIQ